MVTRARIFANRARIFSNQQQALVDPISDISELTDNSNLLSSSIKYVTLDQAGTLQLTTGTARWYAQESITITKIVARVDTTPSGSSINIQINKNGSQAVTMSISAGSTKSTNQSPSLTMVEDDYLTVDITQIGSTNAGENLKVTLTYE